jgi:hypothetical protein
MQSEIPETGQNIRQSEVKGDGTKPEFDDEKMPRTHY